MNLSSLPNGNSFNEDSEHDTDQLDLQIIAILQTDGRSSYSYIARQLDVPEATVRYRVKRLLEEKIITISAFLNTGKLAYANVASLELVVEPDFFESTLETLANSENVCYIASYTGESNLVLEYVYRDNEELLEFINWLKAKPEISKLTSRIILKIHKAQYPIRIKPKS